jgi:hypothetical protein
MDFLLDADTLSSVVNNIIHTALLKKHAVMHFLYQMSQDS